METEKLKVKLLKDGPSNSTIFVLGSTGCGKTTLIANLLLAEPRFLIIDTRNEYDPVFFGSDTVIVNSLVSLCDALNDAKLKIIFKLPASNQEETLGSAISLMYEFQRANSQSLPPITFAMDETNKFCETSNCPDSLEEIVTRGRDFQIKKVFGAQWFGTIPTWMRDSLSEIYVFQHKDRSGLNRLTDFGFDPEEVKNLHLYTCLHSAKNEITRIQLIG